MLDIALVLCSTVGNMAFDLCWPCIGSWDSLVGISVGVLLLQ